MNRLWKKFICGIAAIMIFTLVLSLAVNVNIVQRYYLHRQTRSVRQVGNRLKEYLNSGVSPEDVINILERDENVLIVYSDYTSDSEMLSNDLREQFRQKGLGFQKFWLWEQDYDTAVERGVKLRLYEQDKLKYGILAEYVSTDEGIFAIAAVVPGTAEAVEIINQFLIILITASSVLAAVLMYILVKHITNPLKKMEEFSHRISSQDYDSRLDINTNDELEIVADSMNQMSHSIQQYQKMLIEKNQQMESLLDDVAHDLKTPISLIGTYASGIRDGLDDGTFLDTIIRQNEKMAGLTEQLLGLSRIGQREYPVKAINIASLLMQEICEQQILAEKRNLEICYSAQPDIYIEGNSELIRTIFSNLLSNAIKYAAVEKRAGDTEDSAVNKRARDTENSELTQGSEQCIIRSMEQDHKQFSEQDQKQHSGQDQKQNSEQDQKQFSEQGQKQHSIQIQEQHPAQNPSGQINVCLIKADRSCIFIITNQVASESLGLDLNRIWEPFYVGEPSRNHNLSGTGLGLSIVRKIADQCNYGIGCEIDNGKIRFSVTF